ncbi:MAG: LssY C-terminal domain-containing protein [Bryobacteraceae bacterium]
MQAAFKLAGWSPAHELSGQSVMETVRAVAEMRGYKEAPMSRLLLDGRRSNFEFQKGNNTFAKRHHLRVWQRPETYQDKPIWVSSSTHDIGIEFSQENRTFIHLIDPQIDRERGKVVSDLLFTGKVESIALVARPEVPRDASNATGDKLVTDGRMAVILR